MMFAEIVWIIAIFLALVAIFSIVPIEIALNAFVISTAIFSLIWVNITRKNLSKGSSLAGFALYLFSSIVFFLLSSIFQLIIKIFLFPILIWFSYISLAVAYLLLVVSAYKLMQIGKEFGFAPETEKIKKLLKNKGSKEKLEKLERIERVKRKSQRDFL